MDGSARTVLHTTDLQTPRALAIDYTSQTLYWADSTLNRLESSRTDGSNRRLLSTNVQDPYAMTFFAGRLYWTVLANNSIYTALSILPNNVTSLIRLNSDPYGIHVIDEGAQYEGLQKLRG